MRNLNSLIAIATLALVSGNAIASAQTAPPKPTAPVAAPAVRPAQPVPVPGIGAPVGSIARNVAATPDAARIAYQRNLALKQTECQGKGPLYKYTAPHVAGDSDGKGGFYTNNTSGSCRRIVTAAQMQALQAAGLIKP
jgi:pyruvate/2-oxoglutarate dehydrogenase complex dihydrolipoamide acyltransferase (E2) component